MNTFLSSFITSNGDKFNFSISASPSAVIIIILVGICCCIACDE